MPGFYLSLVQRRQRENAKQDHRLSWLLATNVLAHICQLLAYLSEAVCSREKQGKYAIPQVELVSNKAEEDMCSQTAWGFPPLIEPKNADRPGKRAPVL